MDSVSLKEHVAIRKRNSTIDALFMKYWEALDSVQIQVHPSMNMEQTATVPYSTINRITSAIGVRNAREKIHGVEEGLKKDPTAYATPITTPMVEQEKQGGKCCGGWYVHVVFELPESRPFSSHELIPIFAATTNVAAITDVQSLFSAFIVSPSVSTTDPNDYQELKEISDKYGKPLVVISIIHIIMTIVALVGAIIFNFWMVALYAVWSILNLALTIVFEWLLVSKSFDWIDTQVDDDAFNRNWDDVESALNIYMYIVFALTIIFTLLWTYPSFFLAAEIKKGIMTKETYPREEFSCCCTSPR
eukprot:scaffold22639_cov105-Cylindrotheca_fusiformis.AAC.1